MNGWNDAVCGIERKLRAGVFCVGGIVHRTKMLPVVECAGSGMAYGEIRKQSDTAKGECTFVAVRNGV